MDEDELLKLWPALLAHGDLLSIEQELAALAAQRESVLRDFDTRIAAMTAQRDRRHRIVAPVLAVELADLDLWVRFWSKVRVIADEDSCWLYTGSTRKGRNEEYGRFNVEGRDELAHRVAWKLMHPGEPMPPAVRHSCDNPPCCRPKHLLGGTQADNVEDAAQKGRMRGKTYQRGEANDSSVLTAQIVLEARRRYRLGESAGQLAKDLGVALGTLQGALSGQTWSHLNDIEAPTVGRRSGSHINEEIVRTIRTEYALAMELDSTRGAHTRACADLGMRHTMTVANVNAIVRRKSWAHVE
jgi:hypothetical protein